MTTDDAVMSQNKDEERQSGPSSFNRIKQNHLLIQLRYFPLTLSLLYFTVDRLPIVILLFTGVLEFCTAYLLWKGRGPHRLGLRQALRDANLLGLLCLSQNWLPRVFSVEVVTYILILGLVELSLTLAYQLRLLQKRFIADTLSGANLVCGILSIQSSAQGKYGTSLIYLLIGAAFDGFDGAAARRFGGTRFGVYSDDIADGMNYGVAPGFALYYLLGGVQGFVIGVFYAIFTISRLLFFTLSKDDGDPNYFSGIPSPVGGMIVMCSIVLFQEQLNWVCFLVGIACTQMVSFSTYYRHLGRAFSNDRRARMSAPIGLIIFVVGGILWGVRGSAAVVLTGAICYGFLPSMLSFYSALKSQFSKDVEHA